MREGGRERWTRKGGGACDVWEEEEGLQRVKRN